MSSQPNESSSSQRNNENVQSTSGGEGDGRTEQPDNATGTAASSQPSHPAGAGEQHNGQAPPHQQQQQQRPPDVFGMLANIIPQAMEGIMNSMFAGGGGAGPRQGEQQQAAPGGVAHEPPPPRIMEGIERLTDMMRQQQNLWGDMGERINQLPDEIRRRADEARDNNDPMANILAHLEGALENMERQQAHRVPPAADGTHSTTSQPAATAAPLNFMEHLTAAASGLAGTGGRIVVGGGTGGGGGGGGNGQSFMERLQAATAAAGGGGVQPGTSNQSNGGATTAPPPQGDQRTRHVFELPQFGGGARIEIVGLPGNLDQMFRQMREGFDPSASSETRIPEEHLARLPNSSVKQHHVDDGKQCFICMDQYTEVGERVAEMTCAHIFHTDCIIPWLKRNTTCPVCRAEVVSRNWIFDEMELD